MSEPKFRGFNRAQKDIIRVSDRPTATQKSITNGMKSASPLQSNMCNTCLLRTNKQQTAIFSGQICKLLFCSAGGGETIIDVGFVRKRQ